MNTLLVFDQRLFDGFGEDKTVTESEAKLKELEKKLIAVRVQQLSLLHKFDVNKLPQVAKDLYYFYKLDELNKLDMDFKDKKEVELAKIKEETEKEKSEVEMDCALLHLTTKGVSLLGKSKAEQELEDIEELFMDAIDLRQEERDAIEKERLQEQAAEKARIQAYKDTVLAEKPGYVFKGDKKAREMESQDLGF